MRIIYMGTPYYSVPVLDGLLQSGEEVVGVYCQPDRPAGRGREPTSPAIKDYALKKGLEVFQPASLQLEETYAQFVELKADISIVVGFGKILPYRIIHASRFGCLNLHPSLLPKLRGASPITSALLQGEDISGVTIIELDEGMDSGPIVAQKQIAIREDDTTLTLTGRMFSEGAKLLMETLPRYTRGELTPELQDTSLATYCKKIEKAEGRIDWHQTAKEIYLKIRAYYPWPGSYTYWNRCLLKVIKAVPGTLDSVDSHYSAGQVFTVRPDGEMEIHVATGRGSIRLEEVQLEGKRAMPIQDFIKGHKAFSSDHLPS